MQKIKKEDVVRTTQRTIDIQPLLQLQSASNQRVSLRSLRTSQAHIIQSRLGVYDSQESNQKGSNFLQISVGNDSKLYDLDKLVPKEIHSLEDTERFGMDPESYIETGFNIIFKDEEEDIEHNFQPNDKFTSYIIKNSIPEQRAIAYMCCDEIDLNLVSQLNQC